jgi:hypothetical protein
MMPASVSHLVNTVPHLSETRFKAPSAFFNRYVPKHLTVYLSHLTQLCSFCAFTEILRKHPVASFVERKCCSDDRLPVPR